MNTIPEIEQYQIVPIQGQFRERFVQVTRVLVASPSKEPVEEEIYKINVKTIDKITSTMGITTLVLNNKDEIYIKETAFELGNKIFWL